MFFEFEIVNVDPLGGLKSTIFDDNGKLRPKVMKMIQDEVERCFPDTKGFGCVSDITFINRPTESSSWKEGQSLVLRGKEITFGIEDRDPAELANTLADKFFSIVKNGVEIQVLLFADDSFRVETAIVS